MSDNSTYSAFASIGIGLHYPVLTLILGIALLLWIPRSTISNTGRAHGLRGWFRRLRLPDSELSDTTTIHHFAIYVSTLTFLSILSYRWLVSWAFDELTINKYPIPETGGLIVLEIIGVAVITGLSYGFATLVLKFLAFHYELLRIIPIRDTIVRLERDNRRLRLVERAFSSSETTKLGRAVLIAKIEGLLSRTNRTQTRNNGDNSSDMPGIPWPLPLISTDSSLMTKNLQALDAETLLYARIQQSWVDRNWPDADAGDVNSAHGRGAADKLRSDFTGDGNLDNILKSVFKLSSGHLGLKFSELLTERRRCGVASVSEAQFVPTYSTRPKAIRMWFAEPTAARDLFDPNLPAGNPMTTNDLKPFFRLRDAEQGIWNIWIPSHLRSKTYQIALQISKGKSFETEISATAELAKRLLDALRNVCAGDRSKVKWADVMETLERLYSIACAEEINTIGPQGSDADVISMGINWRYEGYTVERVEGVPSRILMMPYNKSEGLTAEEQSNLVFWMACVLLMFAGLICVGSYPFFEMFAATMSTADKENAGRAFKAATGCDILDQA